MIQKMQRARMVVNYEGMTSLCQEPGVGTFLLEVIIYCLRQAYCSLTLMVLVAYLAKTK